METPFKSYQVPCFRPLWPPSHSFPTHLTELPPFSERAVLGWEWAGWPNLQLPVDPDWVHPCPHLDPVNWNLQSQTKGTGKGLDTGLNSGWWNIRESFHSSDKAIRSLMKWSIQISAQMCCFHPIPLGTPKVWSIEHWGKQNYKIQRKLMACLSP